MCTRTYTRMWIQGRTWLEVASTCGCNSTGHTTPLPTTLNVSFGVYACKYVCVYIYVSHTHTYVYIFTHVYISYMYVYIYTYWRSGCQAHVYVHMCYITPTHTNTNRNTHTYIYKYIYICTYIYTGDSDAKGICICMYVCICACIFIDGYFYKHVLATWIPRACIHTYVHACEIYKRLKYLNTYICIWATHMTKASICTCMFLYT